MCIRDRHSTDERASIMTNAAIFTGHDMIDWLTSSKTSAMTRFTAIHDANVTEGCWQEARSLVAITAVAVSRHVGEWFTRRSHTIMTGRTVTHDTGVVKTRADKGRGVMAHGTIICCRKMVQ